MKPFLLSLIAAIFIAGQLFTPAGAAPLTSSACGNTYTVRNKDTLISIAELCGTTVSNILALNPQVSNANLIYNGQELRIGGKVIPGIATYITTASTTYTIQSGDTLLKIAAFYRTSIWEILQANPGMNYFTRLSPGMKLNIPVTRTFVRYRISETATTYYLNARVTLSATEALPGDDIIVYVSGFPPGAWIDYHIGVNGAPSSLLYDGTVDENGTTSLKFEIPAGAKKGDNWVIFVATTSQKDGVEAYSSLIKIKE